jgi:hypothetical protein
MFYCTVDSTGLLGTRFRMIRTHVVFNAPHCIHDVIAADSKPRGWLQ